MNEFLHMGHYAFYVWSAYAVTLIVMTANVWGAWNRYQKNVLKAMDIRRLQGKQSYDA